MTDLFQLDLLTAKSDHVRPLTEAVPQAAQALSHILRQSAISRLKLRSIMEKATNGCDTNGDWSWASAYEACEGALSLVLTSVGGSLLGDCDGAELLDRLARHMPSRHRRDEDTNALQQFSTPVHIARALTLLSYIDAESCVLEPSAGTGLFAAPAAAAGAQIILNEIDPVRSALLSRIFPHAQQFSVDGAFIDAQLPINCQPTHILINPPFNLRKTKNEMDIRGASQHVRSAYDRLSKGGRLAAILPTSLDPSDPGGPLAFLNDAGTILLNAVIERGAFAKAGTTIATRVAIVDKSVDQAAKPTPVTVTDADDLLEAGSHIGRPNIPSTFSVQPRQTRIRKQAAQKATTPILRTWQPTYDVLQVIPRTATADIATLTGDYDRFSLMSIDIKDAPAHPTELVQSKAMASVAPPPINHQPNVPKGALTKEMLSEAQLETLTYASAAFETWLNGTYTPSDDGTRLIADEAGESYRRGFFLGDGTGCGKGRQIASIIYDQICNGHRKAVWISKTDALFEDAKRDWAALGADRQFLFKQSQYRPNEAISAQEGILFVPYTMLRMQGRESQRSRLEQLQTWLGPDFEGVIAFDEAHEMANAAGKELERGKQKASLQGIAGITLQNMNPKARILYASATGATEVQNLGYAARLGLWGTGDFPFVSRDAFFASMAKGGVAAMEVVARELKAVGLYTARSLSFAGTEVDMLNHTLTDEERYIWDQYAEGYQIIHRNLHKALEAAAVTSSGKSLNSRAKAAALSAFESGKQRFFNALLTSMMTQSMIADAERQLKDGNAVVIQIISTNEAITERRLASLSPEDPNNGDIDVTPREYILDYLRNAFPVAQYTTYTDEDGNLRSRTLKDTNGDIITCPDAVARRDALLLKICALPSITGAIDQVMNYFGTDKVAEVTGRTRRLVHISENGQTKMRIQRRGPTANIAEGEAFMRGDKDVLIFSTAGGTGRSYHADNNCGNKKRRIHYLLEAGWRADIAIQGLGRTHRTNQAQPPLYRPLTADIRGQRRFISTIARRLASLGALTKGQSSTGGQGLFKETDNLESDEAYRAMYKLLDALFAGKAGYSLERFETMTGLMLQNEEGKRLDRSPTITRFLNRLLALPINDQNQLFDLFDALLGREVDEAKAAGTYQQGVEELTAESLTVQDRKSVHTDQLTSAETHVISIRRKRKNTPVNLHSLALDGTTPVINNRSRKAAIAVHIRIESDDPLDDELATVRLYRPSGSQLMSLAQFKKSGWEPVSLDQLKSQWNTEIKELPPYREDTIHLVTGLILKLWDKLDSDAPKVYRLTTDDGEKHIGRVLTDSQLMAFMARLGSLNSVSPAKLCDLILKERATVTLGDYTLVHRYQMDRPRIELIGLPAYKHDWAKSIGLFHEIVSYRTKTFVPPDPKIIAKLIEAHPTTNVSV